MSNQSICRRLLILCRYGREFCNEYRQKCKCTRFSTTTPLLFLSTSTPSSITSPSSRRPSTLSTSMPIITTPGYNGKCDVCCGVCRRGETYIVYGKVLTCRECTQACNYVRRPVCPIETTLYSTTETQTTTSLLTTTFVTMDLAPRPSTTPYDDSGQKTAASTTTVI